MSDPQPYAVGKPGERAYWTEARDGSITMIPPGAVALPWKGGTPYPRAAISADGKSIVVIEPSAAEKRALAWGEVRRQRNRLLDDWRWTVTADSPLSSKAKTAFQAYLGLLHRVTVDFADPAAVAWPEVPALDYPKLSPKSPI